MKLFSLVCLLSLFFSCSSKTSSNTDTIVSMQLVDRNGMTETISNKERLKPFQEVDFSTPQPYQKVLRVYQKNPHGQATSRLTSYHTNGQIRQYLEVVDGRANGVYREWFSNGQLRIEVNVVEGLADISEVAQQSWIFDQTSNVWDERGCLLATFHYDKGRLDAPAIYYHPNGQVQKIIPYSQGVIHGTIEAFDPSGICLEKSVYIEGERQGTAEFRWSADLVQSLEQYDHDRLLEGSYFDAKGALIAKIENGMGEKSELRKGAPPISHHI